MQTFLPYADFQHSAEVLDNLRLRRQRYETLYLIRSIEDPERGYQNHPATNQWRPWTLCLNWYGVVIADECDARGYPNPSDEGEELRERFLARVDSEPLTEPEWLGDERVHSSHRANLLRKDSEWYGQYGWTETPVEGYYWPSKDPENWYYVPTKAERKAMGLD